MRAHFFGLAAAALAAGCVSAPVLSPPAPPPSQWLVADPTGVAAVPDAWWRESVDDATMTALIEQAGEINSVDEALARLIEARMRVRAARGALLPNLAATGDVSRTEPADGPTYDVEQAALSASLDLDVFGAGRNRVRANAASAAEQDAALRLARINARRTAADLYIAVRLAQAQKAAAQAAQDAAEDSLILAESRYRAGLDSGLSSAQARAARDAARARTPGFEQAETEARLALEALLGLPPGALLGTFSQSASVPTLTANRLLASPAEVLASHPDIAAAEARLARTGFNAAAARADLWPRMSFEAAFSSVTAPAGIVGFADGEQVDTAFGLTAPLFNFGRLRALAQAEGYAAQAEAARLRQAVLDRLADIETQRARHRNGETGVAAQIQALASAADAADLARARYRSGLTSFIDVLTADRSLYDAQSALAAAQAERARAATALAAALGLGQQP